MTPKRKRPACWYQTAGEAPFTVAVREKTLGGMLYGGAYDHDLGRYTWSSLGHRDRAEALTWAQKQAEALGAGGRALELPKGGPTVAGVLALYAANALGQNAASVQRDDRRRVAMWSRLFGPTSHWRGPKDDAERRVAMVTAADHARFLRERMAGAIDADGVFVPPEGRTIERQRPRARVEPTTRFARAARGHGRSGSAKRVMVTVSEHEDRRPKRARTANADVIFLTTALNWACGFLVNGRPLLDRNPWGAVSPGVPKAIRPAAEHSVRRPTITYDQYLALRAHAPRVMTRVPGEGMVPSHLPALVDLVEDVGRRITSICRLLTDDLRWGTRRDTGAHGIVAVRWPPLKRERAEWIPVGMNGRTADVLEAEVRKRPGMGARPVFPAPKDPAAPITRYLADDWLRRCYVLADVAPLEGGLWHPFRRKWATERKHLPAADVMKAAGWKDRRSLETAYQQPDDETTLAVVDEPRKLRDRKHSREA
jgi:hypothetical protein